jgi:hypothetical protein
MADPTDPGTEPLPPLTVVRAEPEGGVALAQALGKQHPGPGMDHRLGSDPVMPTDIASTARTIAVEQADRNLESRRKREGALLRALETAKVRHQQARDEVGARSATHQQLLQSASWCEESAEGAATLGAALYQAAQELEAARAEYAEAEGRLVSVNEQQAAAEAVLEEAHRQLLELDVAGQSENDVRRSLESANQEAREANTAAEAAQARADRLDTELTAWRERAAELDQQREVLQRIALVDPAPVEAALDRVLDAPLVDPDDATLALAHDLERRLQELDAIGSTPPAPTPEQLAAAEATVSSLRTQIDEMRRPADHSTPDWWEELARLHAAVVDAEAAAGAKRARGGSRKRLEEALAAERVLLDQLGYPSHLDALLSGGRPASGVVDKDALPQAQEALLAAEAELHALYDADAVAANHRRARGDVLRLRALGAALLGVGPNEVTPELLREQRPDPTVADELAAVLTASGSPESDRTPVERARAWLDAREHAEASLRELEQERDVAADHIRLLAPDVEAARADAENHASTARTARRQVEVLEAEMVNRMRPAADPATRAATAAALRDHIAALELRIKTAKAEADDAHVAATSTLASATARFDQARRDTDDLARRAGLAARLLPDPPESGDQLLSDLNRLAEALRAAFDSIDGELGGMAGSVADAAAEEATLTAALSELRARAADEPEPVDHADALRRLLDPAARLNDVVLDPVLGFEGADRQLLLDTLVELGTQRPIVVVDARADLGAWADGLADGVAVTVSAEDASSLLTARR